MATETKFRTALALTFTTHNVAYSLLALITAADANWTAGEVSLLEYRGADGASAKFYEVARGATDPTTGGGYIINPEGETETSIQNDIILSDIWLMTDTDAAVLMVKVRSNRRSRS